MRDEKYVFIQDVRDKGKTARSARYKRSHTGKGGRMKLPSDYMTDKELKAMNGEVKSYRLNEPMTWNEFKSMPDDIKVTYIKLLREKFKCFDSAIAEMMGVGKATFSIEIKRLGIGFGTKHGGNRKWDNKEAFYAWWQGVPAEMPAEEVHEEQAIEEACNDDIVEPVVCHTEEKKRAIPDAGTMTFEGKTEDVLNTLGVLLGGANVHICVTWDVMAE